MARRLNPAATEQADFAAESVTRFSIRSRLRIESGSRAAAIHDRNPLLLFHQMPVRGQAELYSRRVTLTLSVTCNARHRLDDVIEVAADG